MKYLMLLSVGAKFIGKVIIFPLFVVAELLGLNVNR